jgi:hypothetical protein
MSTRRNHAWKPGANFNSIGQSLHSQLGFEPESNKEVCSWMGSVNNHFEDNPEDWIVLSGMDTESDDELEELEGDELQCSLEAEMSQEAEVLQNSDTKKNCNLSNDSTSRMDHISM